MKKTALLLIITLCLLTTGVTPVMAQGGITNPAIGNLGNDPSAASSGTTFEAYFITLWQALISVGGLLVLVYFLWGGIEWISAGGDSGKVQKARDRITQAIIGLVVLVGAFAIITWISQIFFGDDFNILRLQFTNAPSEELQQAGDAAQEAIDDINTTIPDPF